MADVKEIHLGPEAFIKRLQIKNLLTERDELRFIEQHFEGSLVKEIILYFEDKVNAEIRENLGREFKQSMAEPHDVIYIKEKTLDES